MRKLALPLVQGAIPLNRARLKKFEVHAKSLGLCPIARTRIPYRSARAQAALNATVKANTFDMTSTNGNIAL